MPLLIHFNRHFCNAQELVIAACRGQDVHGALPICWDGKLPGIGGGGFDDGLQIGVHKEGFGCLGWG